MAKLNPMILTFSRQCTDGEDSDVWVILRVSVTADEIVWHVGGILQHALFAVELVSDSCYKYSDFFNR